MLVKGLSVVNGCQSLSTVYSVSERVRSTEAKEAFILFRSTRSPTGLWLTVLVSIRLRRARLSPVILRSNDKVMVGLRRAFETRYPDGFFMTKRGEERPADKDAQKTIDAAVLAKMLMAWHCQRPNISYNEKKLFDEHYKILFRTGYDPASIFALQTSLNPIDNAWPSLALNDVLKASRSYVKFHIPLFCVVNYCGSQQTAHACCRTECDASSRSEIGRNSSTGCQLPGKRTPSRPKPSSDGR